MSKKKKLAAAKAGRRFEEITQEIIARRFSEWQEASELVARGAVLYADIQREQYRAVMADPEVRPHIRGVSEEQFVENMFGYFVKDALEELRGRKGK